MDHLALLIILSSVTLLASIFCRSWLGKSSKNRISLPPGPRGIPILGYLPFLKHHLHIQFTELAREYGPIYKLWLGHKLCIVISSPDLVKQVVRDHDWFFSNHDPTIAGLVATHGGLNFVASDNGRYYRNMRKLFVVEMLNSRSLEATYDLRKDEVRRIVKSVCGKIGTAIDIGKLIFVTELNVIMSIIWGAAISGEERDRIGGQFREKAAKLVDLLETPNVSDYFPVFAKFDFQGIAKEMATSVLPNLEGIFDLAINERLKSKKVVRRDVLQVLLEQQAEQQIDLTQIRSLLMDIVIAGTDTSATTVEWAMTELLNNPTLLQKAQQELADVVGMNNTVEESHISKLHYLDAVLKETFRLHPALPLLIPRRPKQTCKIGGYTIPKDCRVYLNAWSNYRDPKIWENPSEFKPERFLNETRKWDFIGNSFEYLPFGSGRRMCPGLPLGEKMVMYLLAALLHSFDWKLPEGEKLDMTEKFGIVLKKRVALFAVPSQRLPNGMYQ